MKLKSIVTICFILCVCISKAQWEVGLGAGIGLPLTGYSEVVKTGWLLNAEGKYRFQSNWAVGMKTQFARLQKDKDPNDAFQNARITVAPLLFVAEYGRFSKGSLQPYATGGLGISFFSVNYDTTPTEGTSEFNVSFTMMPQLGLRYAASPNVYPFIESGLVLLADGPPIGFPKGEKMTGYGFINLGVHYQFN
jgi:opacity protein-like surface antigen